MKFNSEGLQKYSLVTVLREIWCHDMLTVCQKQEDQYTYHWPLYKFKDEFTYKFVMQSYQTPQNY